MNILLLSTGRRVSLIKRLRKTALRMGISLKIYGTEIEKKTPSLYFCDHYFMVPPTKSKLYPDAIIKILGDHNIDAILPGNDLDLEFLSGLDLPNELKHVQLLFSGRDQTQTFLSKTKSSHLFRRLGLTVPEVYERPEEATFPCILKEDRGFGSRGQFIITDQRDLEANYHKLCEPFLQKYIEGEEFTIDVFSDPHNKPINILPRIREKVRSGVSDVGSVFLDQSLLDLLTPKIQKFKLKGPWNIQCIQSTGIYYFLEVNPRFSGGIPLTIEAGMDFCQNLFEWMLGLEISRFTRVNDSLTMMKYDSELFL